MNSDISVRKWMGNCPYVKTAGRNLECGIFPASANFRYHENVLGERVLDEVQEISFILTAKRTYSGSNADYNFFTNIVKWIDSQNKVLNFPSINEGVVKSVVPELNQYVSEPQRGEERCQIQITITYKAFN